MTRSLFATQLYEAEIGDERLLGRPRALDPLAGARRRSRAALVKEHRYAGYTSYASLNDLPKRDPAFARPGEAR